MSSPAYLDQWPLAELPAEQRPLLYLALSFMEAAMAIECFHQAGAATRHGGRDRINPTLMATGSSDKSLDTHKSCKAQTRCP